MKILKAIDADLIALTERNITGVDSFLVPLKLLLIALTNVHSVRLL